MQPEKGRYFFTSESVTEGHPDKVADQISDAILDTLIEQDPGSRVACETLVTTGMAVIAGEISTKGYADLPKVVRETIKEIGYNSSEMGFDWQTCAVISSIDHQSGDIAQGVDREDPENQGAGDQGMMFGFACNETPTLMPAPIYWAHQLSQQLTKARKDGLVDFFRPDGKTQVSFEYVDGKPIRINNVVVSTQHAASASQADIIEAVKRTVIRPVLEPTGLFDEKDCEIFINTTGRFVVGGPMGDCGLTGRKIIQDTYGGSGHHGGGAFSGKDPSKVDRSAAYMGRYVAKNVSAAGLAPRCECRSRIARRGRARVRAGVLPRHERYPGRSAHPRPCVKCSTCAPTTSRSASICSAPSTRRPPATATSVANSPNSRGNIPTQPPNHSAPPRRFERGPYRHTL